MNEPFWTSETPLAGFSEIVIDVGESSLWDTATLGGMKIPGIVKVDGAEAGQKWDVKTAPGSDGATITDQGYEPAKLTITATIWMPRHWTEMQAFIEIIRPKPAKGKKKASPMPFAHPPTNLLGINNVLVLSVAAPKPGGTRGTVEVAIKCIQWLKPKTAQIIKAEFTIDTKGVTEGPATPAATPSPGSSGNSGPT